jgi:ribulose-phosphate 3-epimerase
MGKRAGVALNPSTSLSAIEEVIDDLDLLLIMTVNPGYGGQTLIEHTLDKVSRARAMLDAAGSPADLEVDGGIGVETAGRAAAAGANHLVTGTSVFAAKEGISAAITRIRHAAQQRIARVD